MAAIKDWKLPLNLVGVALFDPGAQIDKLSNGVYTVVCADSEQDASNTAGNCDNVVISFDVTEPGEMNGKHGRIWLPIDPNVGKGINGRKWKNLLAAVVKDPAALEKGVANVNAAFLKGKTFFIHVQEVPGKNAKGYDNLPNVSPITKDQYAAFKAQGYGSVKPAGATANGAAAPMTVTGGPGVTPTAGVPQVAAEVTLE